MCFTKACYTNITIAQSQLQAQSIEPLMSASQEFMHVVDVVRKSPNVHSEAMCSIVWFVALKSHPGFVSQSHLCM